jgi:plasmid stability protein
VAQLIVRNLDDEIVRKLKQQAARNGVSAEEEHRRILEASLLGSRRRRRRSLKEHLMSIPDVGEDRLFVRQEEKPRRLRLT